ncbi:MAG: ferrous iron transport protein B [Oscillospiraceae bacterium]|jgi:ferrous iron transport protein B|nr:ferrous iron transport protein B [Oscillospiraceae bacterium]
MPTIALAGNPNSGKTTLFNALTGSNQFVGNWPGVTVERKEGRLTANPAVKLLDLPGVYSLSPFSPEETITRGVLLSTLPDAILNLVDGSNLERNLYLTSQLLELGIPMLIAVNCVDLMEKRGDRLNLAALERAFGCPVRTVSALKGRGVEALARQLGHLARLPAPRPWVRFAPVLEDALKGIEAALPKQAEPPPRRFWSIKLFERDPAQAQAVQDRGMEARIRRTEALLGDSSDALIAAGRYDQIEALLAHCLRKGQKKDASQRIDRILTHRILALPCFALVMFLVYFISVSTVGAWLSAALDEGCFGQGFFLFGLRLPSLPLFLSDLFARWQVKPWLSSLVLDGLLGGVGTVLGFVPQMMLLFACLSFLEGCGYLARIAFLLDRPLRRFGLSGRAFVPMLLATGCGVPAILSSRTIDSPRERRAAILGCTFLPCSAKLPIIALIAGTFFGGAWWVAPSAYLAGVAAILLSARLLQKSKRFPRGEAPFVLELPSYRLPSPGSLWRGVWERSSSFMKKAGSVILLSSLAVWFLSSYRWQNGRFSAAPSLAEGLLAQLGRHLAWIFAPLGFGNWQAVAASFTAMLAKENAVSTLGVLYRSAEGGNHLAQALSPLAAYAFLLFNLLCAPCVAAVSAMRRELGSLRLTALAVSYQTLLAYVSALLLFQFGRFFDGQGFTPGTAAAMAVFLALSWIFLLRAP